MNYDGTELQKSDWAYGSTPIYSGSIPTKEKSAQYSYVWKEWSPAIAPVSAEATYTAVFDTVVNKFVITFLNYDGTELQKSDWAYGSTPVYSGSTPMKAEDANNAYSFSGWTPEITSASESTTYTAVFTPYSAGFVFSLNSDNKSYGVANYTGSATAVIMPSEYNGLPVTAILDSAFLNCTAMSVGDFSFYECTSLASILVDSANPNFQSIDGVLFSKDGKTLLTYPAGKSKTNYVIPDSVTGIGDEAFSKCSFLASVTISDSVMRIGKDAFENCPTLASVTIGDSVTTIGDSAFTFCTALASIAIPDSVTSIGDEAFSGCKAMENLLAVDYFLYEISTKYLKQEKAIAKANAKANAKVNAKAVKVSDLESRPLPKVKLKISPNIRGSNLIYYGVPGCGKSYLLQQKFAGLPADQRPLRTTFYLDYSYSDFVGQLTPVSQNNRLDYVFIPGPFSKALKKAFDHPDMNKQQLASKIWESANKMRSKIEASDYKDFILGFIFYKYLSEKEENYLKDQGFTQEDIEKLSEEDKDSVQFLQRNVGYFIAYSDLFSTWIKKGKDFDVSNVTDALSAFSRLISPSHRNVFDKIFTTLQTGLIKLGESSASRTKAISDLIQLIKDIPMDGKQDYDVLGFIYEYLIGMFAANAGKKAGEFYTPHEVSLIMSEIVANHLKDRDEIKIYDPTSGSGSLLINIGKSAAKHMADKNKIMYYAQEIKEPTYNLTRMPNDEPIFFGHYLNCGIFDKDLRRVISSTARMDGLMNISYEEYMSLKVMRPSFSEQKKIGLVLDLLDSAIVLHQRECEKLQNLKKALLEKMFA